MTIRFKQEVDKLADFQTIRIVLHNTDLPVLECTENGDWIDLRAAEDVEMKQGDFKIISLGVSMELPDGYEAHILPRSSTFKNFGIILANGMGIIDNSYCGTDDIWGFPAIAMRDTKIAFGDRIAQFRIVKKQSKPKFEVVKTLSDKNRGGFGSTGIK